jgi:hypothetical protein
LQAPANGFPFRQSSGIYALLSKKQMRMQTAAGRSRLGEYNFFEGINNRMILMYAFSKPKE